MPYDADFRGKPPSPSNPTPQWADAAYVVIRYAAGVPLAALYFWWFGNSVWKLALAIATRLGW